MSDNKKNDKSNELNPNINDVGIKGNPVDIAELEISEETITKEVSSPSNNEEISSKNIAIEYNEEQVDLAEKNVNEDNKFVINFKEEVFEAPPIEPEPFIKKRKRKRKKRVHKKRTPLEIIVKTFIAFIILAITAFICIVIISSAVDFFGFRSNNDKEIEFKVPPKATVTEISELLEEQNLIRHSIIFKAYIKYIVKEVNFKFGDFALHAAMPYPEIIEVLEKSTANNDVVEVLIPEGFTALKIADRLESKGICPAEDFLNVINTKEFDYDFLAGIENTAERPYKLEGYLFPDTYQFYLNEPAENVVKKFLDNFNSKFTQEMRDQATAKGLSIDTVVNLAAIVHGEAPNSAEMSMVSGIYWNRLGNPEEYSKLQSDPTRKYANEVLKPAGISAAIADEYNTYKCVGLPSGPINNPGVTALKATLEPESSNYYFFCTNLETGEFFFAKTYEQHQANLIQAGLNEEGLND